jgi:hypothetical protein
LAKMGLKIEYLIELREWVENLAWAPRCISSINIRRRRPCSAPREPIPHFWPVLNNI